MSVPQSRSGGVYGKSRWAARKSYPSHTFSRSPGWIPTALTYVVTLHERGGADSENMPHLTPTISFSCRCRLWRSRPLIKSRRRRASVFSASVKNSAKRGSVTRALERVDVGVCQTQAANHPLQPVDRLARLQLLVDVVDRVDLDALAGLATGDALTIRLGVKALHREHRVVAHQLRQKRLFEGRPLTAMMAVNLGESGDADRIRFHADRTRCPRCVAA